MILTDHTITAEINNGNIVVEPFIPENLGTNSIDLTLSNTLILYTDSVLDVRKKNLSAPMMIPPEGLILQPNVIYLASTVEYTETLRHVPVIQGKSIIRKIRIICPCDCWLWRCRL
jgi:dCTP deaminase